MQISLSKGWMEEGYEVNGGKGGHAEVGSLVTCNLSSKPCK